MSYPAIPVSPPPVPPEPTSDWRGLRVEWESYDGNVWDLTDYLGGVVLRREGVEGLHFPVITKHRNESNALPGHQLRGWRTQTREVFWPLRVWGDGSDDWLNAQEEFFRSIHPELAGTWKVYAGGAARTLQLTGVFDEAHAFDRDPMQAGWAHYGVALEAAQPYWVGKTVVAGPWGAPNTVDFLPGPPFHISEGAGMGAATINNPGDVDAWPRWIGTNDLSNIKVGVPGSLITVPFPVADGQMLLIDTDIRNPRAILGAIPEQDDNGNYIAPLVGVDKTTELGIQPYAQISPGQSVQLHLEADTESNGELSCEIDPLHFRAFGGQA